MSSFRRPSSHRVPPIPHWVLIGCLIGLMPSSAKAQTSNGLGDQRESRGETSSSRRTGRTDPDDAPGPTKDRRLYVTSHDALGKSGEPIPLSLTVTNNIDSLMSRVMLLNIPNGALIADSVHKFINNEDQATVDITEWNLSNLTISIPSKQTRSYMLSIAALSYPNDGGSVQTAHASFDVAITAETPAAVAAPIEASMNTAPESSLRERPSEPVRGAANRSTPANSSQLVGTAAPSTSVRSTASQPQKLAQIPEARSRPSESAALPALAVPVPPPSSPSETRALVERATRLIKLGDISGARLVLERGMMRGDRRAIFLLAQTYDPRVLRSWNVQGLRPDPDRANVLYDKAVKGDAMEPETTADAGR